MRISKLCLVLAALFFPAQGMLLIGSEAGKGINEAELLLEDFGKLKIELTLEGFLPLGIYLQANASFSVVCQFQIDTDSHPMNVYWLSGDRYIDTKAAKASLARWTFTGLEPKKKYILVLNWQHMGGYVSLSIQGDEMSLTYRDFKMLSRYVWVTDTDGQ